MYILRAFFRMAALVFCGSLLALAETPVLVELFTSQDCSDCPPADALLETIDRTQPFPDAQVIVLSEHVNYWNRLGWRDPFSSHAVTERQGFYVSHFDLRSAYTPQAVVDGKRECVGSDRGALSKAIRACARDAKAPIAIAPGVAPHTVALSIELSRATRWGGRVYAVFALDSAGTAVRGGENNGRTLHDVAIAGDFQKLGQLNKGEPFSASISTAGREGRRLIAFAQDSNGRIVAAALYRVPQP